MAKLIVQNLGSLTVNVSAPQTVLQAIQATGLDWMHACGAKGRCTTCRIVVLQGMEHLGELSPAEQRYRNNQRLKDNERLTCQCMLHGGDITGKVPEQTKLPHQAYS